MLRRLRIQGGRINYTVTRGLSPAPRRAHKCALLMLAPWLGCGGVYSDVGSAYGGVLCPALAPSQAPPLVLRRLGVSFETEALASAHILRIFTSNTPLSVLTFLR